MTSQDELTRHNIFRCAVLDQSPISYLSSDFEEGGASWNYMYNGK